MSNSNSGKWSLEHYLALSRISFLRPSEKRLLLDTFPEPGRLFALTKDQLSSLVGRRFLRATWEPTRFLQEVGQDSEILDRGVIKALPLYDEGYPPQLRELDDAPILLYYRGCLPDPTKPLVAVIGTRRPTGAGRDAACRLGAELSSAGLGVVSGLARGIDAEAHRGCLMGGAPAIAVLANGLNTVYPKSSVGLAREILQRGGALISEYPPGTPPRKFQFPARNRIISGLCRAVVVIQAPERSGALITADFALSQGRDLFVHRVGVAGPASGGSAALAEDGAEVISGGKEILRSWGWVPPPAMDSDISMLGKASSEVSGRQLAELFERELTAWKALSGTRGQEPGGNRP